MKVVNESTGRLEIEFYYSATHTGCGWIEPGGDAIKKRNVKKIKIWIDNDDAITYDNLKEDVVVTVLSRVD